MPSALMFRRDGSLVLLSLTLLGLTAFLSGCGDDDMPEDVDVPTPTGKVEYDVKMTSSISSADAAANDEFTGALKDASAKMLLGPSEDRNSAPVSVTLKADSGRRLDAEGNVDRRLDNHHHKHNWRISHTYSPDQMLKLQNTMAKSPEQASSLFNSALLSKGFAGTQADQASLSAALTTATTQQNQFIEKQGMNKVGCKPWCGRATAAWTTKCTHSNWKGCHTCSSCTASPTPAATAMPASPTMLPTNEGDTHAPTASPTVIYGPNTPPPPPAAAPWTPVPTAARTPYPTNTPTAPPTNPPTSAPTLPPTNAGESHAPTAPPTLAPPPTPSPTSTIVTLKKGMGGMVGDMYLCTDAMTLGLQDSWWYSWNMHPSGTDSTMCNGQTRVAREFVPMVHSATGGSNMLTTLSKPGNALKAAWILNNAKYLLGYNEPDSGPNAPGTPFPSHPAQIAPADAAAAWPKVQQIAALFDPPLIIVSPSCSSGSFDSTGRNAWMDQFLGNCSIIADCDTSLIKYLGFHDYTGDATLMMTRLEGAASIYNMPVWLTEYAIIASGQCSVTGPTQTQHEDYIRQTVPLLDSNTNIFRYAWFASRQTPNACAGSSGLLPYNESVAVLTQLGQLYHGSQGTQRRLTTEIEYV